MIVYHGSYTDIVKIDLSKATPNKDFGKGFYVTNNRLQAEFWAKRQGARHRCQGVVTEFKFADSAFVDNNYKTLRFPKFVICTTNPKHTRKYRMKVPNYTTSHGKRYTKC